MDAEEKYLLKFALTSRIFLIFIQILFNLCIPDHDAGVFQSVHPEPRTFLDLITLYSFEGFSRWDAQYFLHISLHGYTYENTVAFFPLFPIIICKPITSLLLFLSAGLINDYYCTLFVGVLINTIFFSLSTILLFRLSRIVLSSKEYAFVSALLFAINPASVFFTSCYSETTFSFLTFLGLWCLEKQNLFFAALAFGLSASARSNGTLAVGFILYERIKSRCLSSVDKQNLSFLLLFNEFIITGVCLLLCLLPFILYQTYIFLLYCTDFAYQHISYENVKDHALSHGYKLPSSLFSPWCNWTVPLSYKYVQEHYWDVGFLRYYYPKQLPNFLLALPILSITFISCMRYFISNRRFILCLSIFNTSNSTTPKTDVYRNKRCFVYFSHAFFLSIFCAFFIHVQVSTRLLASSSPVLYWVAADLLLKNVDRESVLLELKNNGSCPLSTMRFFAKCVGKSSVFGKLCICFFLSYFVVGTVLHVNYLPWT